MLPNQWNLKRKGVGLDLFLKQKADRQKAKEPPGVIGDWMAKRAQKRAVKIAAKKAKAVQVFFPIYAIRPWQPKVAGKPFDDGYSFRSALEKKGFKVLGGGNFSTVLGHPSSDRVIKVTTNLTDNWLDYVVWGSQKGYSGTFVPKVFSYKKIKGASHEFAVAVMERMDKTLHRVDRMEDNAVVMGLFHQACDGNIMAKLLLEEVSPGLGTFSGDLKKAFARSLDLHGGNLMVRSDGTVCVTDPVANHSSLTHIHRLRIKDFTTVPLPNVVAVNDNEEQENCHDYRTVYS